MSAPLRDWPTPKSTDGERGGRGDLLAMARGYQMAHKGTLTTSSSQLTLFAADSLVSLTPSPVAVADLPTSATSGLSSPDSFASLNPDGSWRKTCQGYSQVMLDGSLEAFSETWPRAGMTRNGTAYQLVPLAPLRRDRVWLVAYPDESRLERWDRGRMFERADEQSVGTGCPLADADDKSQSSGAVDDAAGNGLSRFTRRDEWWRVEPDVGRVAHGVPARMERLRGLGNAIVPQIAEWIARRILVAEGLTHAD